MRKWQATQLMDKKKILVITDSLGLPRTEPQCVNDSEAWPHMLANHVEHEVYTFTRGGATSSDIVQELGGYLGAYTPDIVIVQVGIVDCAPRALTRTELKVVSVLPVIGKLVNLVVKRFRKNIVMARKITYTNKNKFRLNVELIRKKFDSSKVYFVSILPALEKYEKYNPGVTKNIADFNEILEKQGDYITPYTFSILDAITMSDFHHLNKNGHKIVFNAVLKELTTQ
jgi:hypothetical protein